MPSEEKLREILRYLGAAGSGDMQFQQKLAALYEELRQEAPPRQRYRVFPLERTETGLVLTGSSLPPLTGQSAKTLLSESHSVVLLCCTLGAAFERKLRAASARSMELTLLLDACGSALVEEGCDALEQELKERFRGAFLTDRFSPGYGDLPLTLQPEILKALDAARRLGVTVNEQLLMNPTKSVTALIGISDRPQRARIRGCAFCALNETCIYRKGGMHCGD